MASETASINPAHQGKYKDVSLEAFNKAHGECSELAALYDGSKEADDLLLEATEELSYMKAPQDAHINEKPQAADYIEQALENIAQSWKNAENLEELFSLLEEAGASVEHLEKVLVEPLRQTPAFTGEGSGSSYELKSWPRIATVLTHLQQRGIHTEHLDIKVSKLDPDSMRKYPYVLINIHDESGDPQKGMQLLLCDQVGQVCFSSNVIYPAKYFETINKKMIAALPGMRREPQGSNIDSFIARLLSPLDNEKREKPFKAIFHKAVDNKSKAVEKIPLSEALYIKIIKKEIEETGSSTLKKYKIYLPDGSTGAALRIAFSKKIRGLTSRYKLVTDFTEAMGLSVKLTEDILDQLIKEYIKTHKGEEPSNASGEAYLPNGIKTTWGAISQYVKGYPEKFGGLTFAQIKEQNGLTSTSYSADDLDDLIRDWIKSHDGEEPTPNTKGDVTLKNGIKTLWMAIDAYVRKHPEKFDGLNFAQIKEQEGLTSTSYSADDLADLTRDWIKTHDGEEPSYYTKGDVILKNGIKTTWLAIDKYVRRKVEKFGGLTFFQIKEQNGITSTSYTAEDLADLIRDWIITYDGQEPLNKTKGDVFLKNGIKTTWQAIDKYVRTHPEKFDGLTFSTIKQQFGLKKGMAEYNEIIAQMQVSNDGPSGAPPAPLSIG